MKRWAELNELISVSIFQRAIGINFTLSLTPLLHVIATLHNTSVSECLCDSLVYISVLWYINYHKTSPNQYVTVSFVAHCNSTHFCRSVSASSLISSNMSSCFDNKSSRSTNRVTRYSFNAWAEKLKNCEFHISRCWFNIQALGRDKEYQMNLPLEPGCIP